jgi:hypothetical protein
MQPPLERSVRSAEGDFRVGRVFNQTFSVLSRNLLPFCIVTGIAAVPYLFLSGTDMRTPGTGARIGMAAFGVILALVLNALSQAIILYGAFEDMRGRPVDMIESLRVGLSRFFPVVGTAIMVGIFIMLAGFLLLIPAFIVMSMLYVAMPACVVERLGPIKSTGRSAQLTKGNRWKVFGLWFVILIVGAIVQSLLAGLVAVVAGPVVSLIVLLAWNAVFGAFNATVVVVTYRDLRVAKEGVDTDQIAAVFD